VRADETLEELPVAMFSVKGEVRDKIASLQDGAVDYITKPFGVDELLSRVERILSTHGRGSNAVPTASPR
jgi:two-component system alkaline phosphatase synthesis response regulator PhoP